MSPRIVVGGVGQLYQGDLDIARHALERLGELPLDADVALEELSYGAVAAAQRLQELAPEALVLVGARQRGRPPGTVERRQVGRLDLPPSMLQGYVADAVTGYVSLELTLAVGSTLGALPRDTTAIEVEPALVGPSEALSPAAEQALERALRLLRAELLRLGVFLE